MKHLSLEVRFEITDSLRRQETYLHQPSNLESFPLVFWAMWEPTKNLGTQKAHEKHQMSFCEVVKPNLFSLWQVRSLIITLFWNIRMPLKRSAMNEELDHRPQNSQDTNTQSDQKIHHQHPTSAPRPVLHPFGNDQKSLPFGESYRDASPNETFTRRLLENNCRMDQFLVLRQAKQKRGPLLSIILVV